MCIQDVQFQFDNTIYHQTDRVAMESLIFPVLVEIFMDNLEMNKLKWAIDEMANEERYADDTFIVCNDR